MATPIRWHTCESTFRKWRRYPWQLLSDDIPVHLHSGSEGDIHGNPHQMTYLCIYRLMCQTCPLLAASMAGLPAVEVWHTNNTLLKLRYITADTPAHHTNNARLKLRSQLCSRFPLCLSPLTILSLHFRLLLLHLFLLVFSTFKTTHILWQQLITNKINKWTYKTVWKLYIFPISLNS